MPACYQSLIDYQQLHYKPKRSWHMLAKIMLTIFKILSRV